jgi:hypothetical protein
MLKGDYMKKYTHVKCTKDVVEEGIVIFKEGRIYKISGFDYLSLLYYVEPEFYEEDPLPDEFAVSPLNDHFKFLSL